MKKKGIRSRNIFWGIFLLLAAVFLVVSQMGFAEGVGVVSIFFAIFFMAMLIDGLVRLNFGTILFSIAFLCIIFDKPLGIEAITPWAVLGAALLGTIGLNMIFKRKKHYHINISGKNWSGKERSVYVDGDVVEVEEQADNGSSESRVFFKSSFGEAVKYVNTDSFEYAGLECSFGDMKVYFDNAVITGGNATIDLDVSFGAVELYLPKEWSVANQIDASFAGVDEKNRNKSTGSPVVTLTGSVSFAGVSIVYI